MNACAKSLPITHTAKRYTSHFLDPVSLSFTRWLRRVLASCSFGSLYRCRRSQNWKSNLHYEGTSNIIYDNFFVYIMETTMATREQKKRREKTHTLILNVSLVVSPLCACVCVCIVSRVLHSMKQETKRKTLFPTQLNTIARACFFSLSLSSSGSLSFVFQLHENDYD